MPIFSIVLHIGHNIKHYQIKQCLNTSMSQGYKEFNDQSLCDQEPFYHYTSYPQVSNKITFSKNPTSNLMRKAMTEVSKADRGREVARVWLLSLVSLLSLGRGG